MSAFDKLAGMLPANLGEAVALEIFADLADEIEERFPDPNPLASIFKPYAVHEVTAWLREGTP